MCNITLIDTTENVLTPRDVKQITIINSLLGNLDGTGYCLFNDHLIHKSKEEASNFWRENFKEYQNINFINGIYHVRKSSIPGVTTWVGGVRQEDVSNITDEKSHPFKSNEIIVAHNGFLTFRHTHVDAEKYEKNISADLSDSQKFTNVLGQICELGKVTIENIKESLNLFSGAYCLAIKGIKDDFVWLCRGKDRTLYKMILLYDNVPLGIIINTTTTSLYTLGEMILDYGYDYTLTELKENTVYKYQLNSFCLEEVAEVKQDSDYKSKSTVITTGYSSYKQNAATTMSNNIYEDIYETMYDLGLYMSDLVIIAEILFDKSLLRFEENDFKEFYNTLDMLTNEVHKGRTENWNELQKYKNGSVFNLYKDLHYPYFLNSKDELKSYLNKLEKNYPKETQNELPIIQ